MKLLRIVSPFLLVFVIWAVSAVSLSALETGNPTAAGCRKNWLTSYQPYGFISLSSYYDKTDRFENFAADIKSVTVKTPTDGGIRENIPDKYKDRFEKWKTELRSTEFGRQQWDAYANNKKFILNFVISGERGKGAGTDKYLWDDSGNLVGATITLGEDLDKGYPDPIYYPVLNSLSSDETSYSISGKILASTKISHEIGHVNQTANANKNFLQLQDKLMPVYISIFLKNGLDTNDKKLVDIAQQMGGTPVEIWESREYWSEVNAMLFLKERISKENFYCFVFNKIRKNVETYAKVYEPRFDQHSEFADSPCWK
ncbi:MAG TPA: hypothetical protein VGQ55_14650 [Pyrinomonadaceae bacterium]|jgi:hypothetical protein|nr:hypothetical protein [Pyrinomonadaceae bacterium]